MFQHSNLISSGFPNIFMHNSQLIILYDPEKYVQYNSIHSPKMIVPTFWQIEKAYTRCKHAVTG